ncbi:MAG: hypothetical protein MPW15_09965 [Candidatus Manganitrophus sp.]|nr:hypothetical protein [Candidatus Manganitrophus sp.]
MLNEYKDRELFRIDIKHLLEPSLTLTDFSQALTDLAEVVIEETYALCRADLVNRYGTPRLEEGRPASFAICGLGKLGGAELGYASDIELLFVYEGPGQTDGAEPIDNRVFFEKLAQQITHFITAKQEGIFHIDTRLRPHGNAGVLANPLSQLTAYYAPTGEAAPFERQALIKLRWIAGDEALGQADRGPSRPVRLWGDAVGFKDRTGVKGASAERTGSEGKGQREIQRRGTPRYRICGPISPDRAWPSASGAADPAYPLGARSSSAG